MGAGQPHGDRLFRLFGDEPTVERDGDDGRAGESRHDVRHVVRLAESHVADLEPGVLHGEREVPAADRHGHALHVEHVPPVLEVLRPGRGQIDQHAEPVLDSHALSGRVELLHRHAVATLQRLLGFVAPARPHRRGRAPLGRFSDAFGVAFPCRRVFVRSGSVAVHLARDLLGDGVEDDAQPLPRAHLVGDDAPLLDGVLGQAGLEMVADARGRAHHDVVVPVGVRGDHVLVLAARDAFGELHAELVHPLRGHGVVGTEAQLDVVGQPAVLPDAFRRPAVVVEHGSGETVRVRRAGRVAGADEPASIGFCGVDDVRHRPVGAAEIRFHGPAELDHGHQRLPSTADVYSSKRRPMRRLTCSSDSATSSNWPAVTCPSVLA